MSVRAYKIIKIELEKDCTLNWSHDYKWLEHVYGMSIYSENAYNEQGTSTIDIEIHDVDEVKDWLDNHDCTPEEREYRAEVIHKIIDDIGDEGHAEYCLF